MDDIDASLAAPSSDSQEDIFSSDLSLPLSELVRPHDFKSYIGQRHLMSADGRIHDFIRLKYLPSMVLYGPPGVGKTTLASILAAETNYVFVELSATDGTIKDLRELLEAIRSENIKRERKDEDPLSVVVFIDEIHRFRINQQDFLLPLIETGQFVFIGATTVDPKVRIRAAVLSRCQVFELKKLDHTDLYKILQRAIMYENVRRRRAYNLNFIQLGHESKKLLIRKSNGDARKLINFVQAIGSNYSDPSHIYTGTYSPVVLDDDMVMEVIRVCQVADGESKSLNKIYTNLFNTIRCPILRQPAAYIPLVALEKTDHNFNVHIKLKKSIPHGRIDDTNDGFYENRRNRFILPRDTLEDLEYSKQMEYSDTEYSEENGFLSDCEQEYDPIKISENVTPRSKVVTAICYVLILLSKNEKAESIVKYLLLFCLDYTKDNTGLYEVMTLVKTLKKVNINIPKALSNLAERLSKVRKRKLPLSSRIKIAKKFFKGKGMGKQEAEVATPEPEYDEETVAQLLRAPRQETGFQPRDQHIEYFALNDSTINIGEPLADADPSWMEDSQPSEDNNLVYDLVSQDSVDLSSVGEQNDDQSFILFSDNSYMNNEK